MAECIKYVIPGRSLDLGSELDFLLNTPQDSELNAMNLKVIIRGKES